MADHWFHESHLNQSILRESSSSANQLGYPAPRNAARRTLYLDAFPATVIKAVDDHQTAHDKVNQHGIPGTQDTPLKNINGEIGQGNAYAKKADKSEQERPTRIARPTKCADENHFDGQWQHGKTRNSKQLGRHLCNVAFFGSEKKIGQL